MVSLVQCSRKAIANRSVTGDLKTVVALSCLQNGGFYSAEDADSLADADHAVKKEGAFCVWQWDELTELLREKVPGHEQLTHAEVFIHHYGVKRDGNTDPLQVRARLLARRHTK